MLVGPVRALELGESKPSPCRECDGPPLPRQHGVTATAHMGNGSVLRNVRELSLRETLYCACCRCIRCTVLLLGLYLVSCPSQLCGLARHAAGSRPVPTVSRSNVGVRRVTLRPLCLVTANR
jgi:hypothetical protein